MTPGVRDVVDLLRLGGLDVEEVFRSGGGHWKIRVSGKRGRRTLVIANSPGDWRSTKNQLAQARRAVRDLQP